MNHKRTFGLVEVGFDLLYLGTVLILAVIILAAGRGEESLLFGIMALVLVFGDAFHLIPRIRSACSKGQLTSERMLGIGKMITSIGMTLFYVILWTIGTRFYQPAFAPVWSAGIYVMAALRILLALMPQNQWGRDSEYDLWGIYRNIPFLVMGLMTGILFYLYRDGEPFGFRFMWLAIFLSFAFYLPVVVGVKKYPALGMLMLPKSCAYIWMIAMGLMVFPFSL